ncbi:MAG: methyltransferase domain-containing protein [Actinobacteria bacterium]|nr:methyltransferase domain-containing protein [Actinomycetota bacterium]
MSNVVDAVSAWPTSAHVLDVGCATGDNTLALLGAGYRATGIEIDEQLVKTLRNRPGGERVPVCVGDGTAMPFPASTFDGAILIEVFEHVPEPGSLVAEIARVVGPGGRLTVAVPTGYTEAIYWRLHPRYAENATHVRRYRRNDVEAVLTASGFTVEQVTTRNFVPAVSWFFHSLLRSRSDHTGAIFDHLWIDRALRVVFGAWRRVPVARRGLDWLERRVGKSWYFHCAKSR